MLKFIINKIINFVKNNNYSRSFLLKFFNKLHNLSYHWIGLLASYGGVHPKHRIINYHKFFLDNISNSDIILDIGCSAGEVAFDLAKKAKRVTGIDILKNKIDKAKKLRAASNITYLVGDATNYAFTEKYDAIILSNVLEHINKRVEFLKKIKFLSPKMLIRVPLVTRDWISCYKKEIGLPYFLDKTHYIEYTEEDFIKEIKEAGLKIESLKVGFGELYSVVSH